MPKYDQATVEALYNIGLIPIVEFGTNSKCIPSEEVFLKPQEMVEYLEHGDPYLFEKLNVDPELYEKWQAEGGDAKCAAMVKSGKRHCDRVIGAQLEYHPWVALHRQDYCTTHWNLMMKKVSSN